MHPLTRDLLAWYDAHQRDLPWRTTVSPYRTWLSEVMLQQTRVETVRPYFERFLAQFPTVEALAAAESDAVLALWSGLGYYSRARNLHATAQIVARAGKFPETLAGLRALPGVGEYMAGAIGSIALGLDAAAVDGNLHRVLARLHCDGGDRKQAWKLAESLLPSGRAGDFNQALMDLGATCCTPRAPACPRCPLRARCAAHQGDVVDRYPTRTPKKAVPARVAVAGAWLHAGRLLLVRRPASGLYGGLYELPGDLIGEGESIQDAMARVGRERLGCTLQISAPLGCVAQTLTHMKLTVHVLPITAPAPPASLAHYTAMQWVDPARPSGIGLSTLARKTLRLARAPQGVLFAVRDALEER